jgi:hypothetical protein
MNSGQSDRPAAKIIVVAIEQQGDRQRVAAQCTFRYTRHVTTSVLAG